MTFKHTLHACYFSFITQAIINNVSPLLFLIFQNQFDISFEMIGVLISINFGTQIITDFAAANLVDKIGFRKSAILAHSLSIIGLIGLGTFPFIFPSPYVGLIVAVIIYAVGAGFIDVFVNPTLQSLPGDAKDSAMSLLHSFYCWGQVGVVVITTVLIAILGENLWFLVPIAWSLIPMYNLFKWFKVPLAPPIPEGSKISMGELFKSKVFFLLLILMICAGSAELNMSQWSSTFAEKALDMPKMFGDLMGPALFAVLMGVGRTIYGIWGHKMNLRITMTASAFMCAVCYIVTAVASNPIFSLLGLAFTGFFVSILWPGTFSIAGNKFPTGGGIMFGLMAMFGNLGGTIGPWTTGFVSDLAQKSNQVLAFGQANNLAPEQLGLKMGLLTGAIFPLMLVIGIMFLRKLKDDKAANLPADQKSVS